MQRNQLEYFVAVADHGGFTSAAHAIHVSQSALSQAIKALEAEVGGVLFYRTTRGARLTAAGQALLGPARQVLRGFDAASAAVLNVEDLTTGWLDIVSMPMLAADPVATLIGRFHAKWPGVTHRVSDPGAADIIDLVSTGVHEIGVTLDPGVDTGLHSWTSGVEPLRLVTSAQSGLTDGAVVTPDKLAELGLVVNSGSRRLLTRQLRDIGVEPRFHSEVAQREALLPLVLAGVGAAIMAPGTAAAARGYGALVCTLDPPIERQVSVLWRPEQLTPSAQAFVGLLRTFDTDRAAGTG